MDHPILVINEKQMNSVQFQSLMSMKMSDVFGPLVMEHVDSESKIDSEFRKPFEFSGNDLKK